MTHLRAAAAILLLSAASFQPPASAAEPEETPRKPAPEAEQRVPQAAVPKEIAKVLSGRDPELRSEAPLDPRIIKEARLGPADEKLLSEKLQLSLSAPGGLSRPLGGRITNGQFLSLIRTDSRRRADALIARHGGRPATPGPALEEARALYYDRGWAFDEPRQRALSRIVSAGVPQGKTSWSAMSFGVLEAPAARPVAMGPASRVPAAAAPVGERPPVAGHWEGDTYRTTNFKVAAGPDRAYAQEIAEEAERQRRTLSAQWLGAASAPPVKEPIPIKYSLYGPGSRGGGGSTTYDVGPSGITNTRMSIQGDRESLLKNILPHEVLHTVLSGKLGAIIPRWADEGAASTNESSEEQKKKYLSPLNNAFARSRQFGLNEMFTMKEYPTDINRTWEFYGQSNSLAHFLIEKGGGGAAGRQTFVHFLERGMAGEDWNGALSRTYGGATVKSLESDWTRWHAAGGTAGAIARVGAPEPGTELPVTALPEPPAPMRSGGALNASQALAEARRSIAAAEEGILRLNGDSESLRGLAAALAPSEASEEFDAKRGAITLSVQVSGGGAGGSGTIIGSLPAGGNYRNIIITAGHTFDGYGGAPISVTVMEGGKPVVYKARMVKYSYERRDMMEFELAVLEFDSKAPLQATRVAADDAAPGDVVYVVGKSYQESEITVHRTRMSKPNTIGDGTFSRRQSTTEYIPVSGHSGGGLLNSKGELVGVVSGGNGRQGVHTPLEGIHRWLDGLGLSSLYRD